MQVFKIIRSKDGRDCYLVEKDGGKVGIISVHKFIYEKANGPVPEGYDIHHIDFDRHNNDISNLIAIPRQQHKKYHYCVNRIRALAQNNTNIKFKSNKTKEDARYKELYRKGFRAVKIYNDENYEVVLMRDHIGNEFHVPKPLFVNVELSNIKIKKYSYEELIGMGYKFIKKIRDRETISYLFESPYGNKVCKKECDLFQNKD